MSDWVSGFRLATPNFDRLKGLKALLPDSSLARFNFSCLSLGWPKHLLVLIVTTVL